MPENNKQLNADAVKAAVILQQQKPFTWNQSAVDSKINTIKTKLNEYVGKAGHNPFVWLKENLQPLIDRMNGYEKDGVRYEPENSEVLFNAFMKLPDSPTPIAKGAEHNAKDAPKQAQAAGATDTRKFDESVVRSGVSTDIK